MDFKVRPWPRPRHDIVLHYEEGDIAFEPKQDITPWELTQNVKLLTLAVNRCQYLNDVYKEMTEGAKRHWVKVEE